MIKSYSLQYVSQEIEQLYRQSMLTGLKYRREYLYAVVSTYLILIIIKYQNSMPIIFASIGLALIITSYIAMKKYQQYKEIFVVTNILFISVVIESLRLYGQESSQWYYGYHSSVLKILIYLTGSSFIFQTFFFLLSQIGSFYNFQTFDIYAIISQCIISILLVLLRYQYEMIDRKLFLINLSKVQYENILEDLLPSWVVIVKYNKLAGLLDIEKINKHLKEKFNLYNNEALRDFLRKLVFFDTENQNAQQFIKIEHQIIKDLKLKNQDHPVQKYFAVLEAPNNSRIWKFRVTQVYFNSFQPQVLLFFEEIQEDKYDYYVNAIEQRDRQLYYNAKVSLKQINHQLEIIQQFYHEISKHECLTPVQQNLKQQLQLNYFLYNLNSNLFNQYQISYRQIQSDISNFKLNQFITDLCLNLQIKLNQDKNEDQNLNPKNIFLKTDKQKLISIIMNLVQFIKLLLSIIHCDNNIINQAQPLKQSIKLSIKQPKNLEDTLQFTLSHPSLNINNSIITQLQDIQPFSLDDDKRNWEYKNYFDKIISINQTLQQMLNIYKKEISSYQCISIDNSKQINPQYQNVNDQIKQQEYNTVGFIIAQYFVSRLGPYNKFTFKQSCYDLEGYNTSQYIGLQQTKIQFSIYKNYLSFQKEMLNDKLNYFENDVQIQSGKMTNQEIFQKLYQLTRKTK
ncbi:unnamed protein product [Paramecium primaurelia]|uniref:Transmembrane protein n=1 Tax=Paramecium primaurelia TaxID=5886 RepID=A0A8S1KR29_PARPR|nr:unnamed protein product [Paramecium primaurelia]